MADDNPAELKKAATVATSSQRLESSPSATVRQRLNHRQSTPNLSRSPRPTMRRRSSLLSYSSIEEVTNALTDDIINPSMTRPRTRQDYEEVTHWHSTPLAFAMLPAVGGLLFKNGSAFMTDILLLVLAAIFMNWSIRLPWDWYYTAQSQRRDVEPDFEDMLEEMKDEDAVDSASSAGNSPKPPKPLDSVPESDELSPRILVREKAAAELRRSETIALIATFIFPVLTAYLLHLIRGQLSPSSTGLVSDYNLTIFLLAAEIRPFRQVIRLITSHTLHLQRTVTGLNDPFGAAVEEKKELVQLKSRMEELEAKLTSQAVTATPQTTSLAQKTDISELSSEMRKRYEPRLEGLERAVRRYEKRSATLAMVTEQRLGSLEARLQDALSLAAVAAQQSQTRSTFGRLMDYIAGAIMLPMQMAWRIAVAPLAVLEEVYGKGKGLLFGSQVVAVSKKSGGAGAGKEERLRERNVTRKLAR